jgi:hypothetical protein
VTANLYSFSRLHDYLATAFFMRGRMAGMRLLAIKSLLLADEGLGDSRFVRDPPVDFKPNNISFVWVLIAMGVIVTVIWCILSVMSKGKKTSLWQDEDSEMDSSKSVW